MFSFFVPQLKIQIPGREHLIELQGFVSALEPIAEARGIGAGLGHILCVSFFSCWARKSMVSPMEVKVLLPEKTH